MAVTPNERLLITGSTDTTVKVWSLPDLTLVRTLTDRKKTVSTVILSQDGQYFVVSYYGGRVAIHTLDVGTPATGGVAFSHDNRYLAVGAADRNLRVWELA